MAEDEERLKKERHDFRHHLAVLKSITIESDLCVIVGNLMENAVEACMRAADKKQAFIRINSSLNYDTLTITVDNSHSGMIKKKDNFFL